MPATVLTEQQINSIIATHNAGVSVRQIARDMNINRNTVRYTLRSAGLDTSKHRHVRVHKEFAKDTEGYITVYHPWHPHADKNGRVKEHLLVATERLGRSIRANECVHHINGNKQDNRKENLLICSREWHGWLHTRLGQYLLDQLSAGFEFTLPNPA